MKVILKQDDIDFVDGEKRIGIAIFPFDENLNLDDEESIDENISSVDCIERIYQEGESNAWIAAREICEMKNYEVILEI